MRASLRAGVAVSIFAAMTVPSHAQTAYPNKPIRLIVGFTAGGPTDGPARKIADDVGKALGQTVVVENKPGAGGKIALEYVLTQPRDGYTLLLCTYIDVINTVLYKKVSYSLSDIEPISTITRGYYVLSVGQSVPVNTIGEFIDYAKSKQGQLNYGQVGAGSQPELITRQFGHMTKVDMTSIAYRGTAEAVRDLISGNIQFLVGPLQVTMPLVQSKQLKALAVTSPERLAAAPDVPTLKEQGIPLVSYGWLGVCGAKGIDAAILQRLNREVVTAVASPGYRTLVETNGVIPMSSTQAEMTAIMEETARDSGKIIRELGLTQD